MYMFPWEYIRAGWCFQPMDVANKDRYIYIRCPLSIFLYQKMAVYVGGPAHFRSVSNFWCTHPRLLVVIFFFFFSCHVIICQPTHERYMWKYHLNSDACALGSVHLPVKFCSCSRPSWKWPLCVRGWPKRGYLLSEKVESNNFFCVVICESNMHTKITQLSSKWPSIQITFV